MRSPYGERFFYTEKQMWSASASYWWIIFNVKASGVYGMVQMTSGGQNGIIGWRCTVYQRQGEKPRFSNLVDYPIGYKIYFPWRP